MHTNPDPAHKPIGIFDSGVGGLSVLRAVCELLPHESILYMADQAHIPYGPRQKSQIRDFSFGITDFLLAKGAKLVVVACNTASAAALHDLRARYPEVPFVGMEPALKPAASVTKTGRVGVLATPTTFAGDLYHTLVDRFGQGIEIFQNTCPGLVEQVERAELDTPGTRTILEAALEPMLGEGVDMIVLGCSHYPFVIPLIESITGPDVQTIDPAPAIARQTQLLLNKRGWLNQDKQKGALQFFTSSERATLKTLLPKLLFNSCCSSETFRVSGLSWQDHRLVKLP